MNNTGKNTIQTTENYRTQSHFIIDFFSFIINGILFCFLVFEDDDVAILDMITRTGGDLSQPRRVTGSSSRQPDLEDFNRQG